MSKGDSKNTAAIDARNDDSTKLLLPIENETWYPSEIATQCEFRESKVAGFDYWRLSTRWGSFDIHLPTSGPENADWWHLVTTNEGWWGELQNFSTAEITEKKWGDGKCWEIIMPLANQNGSNQSIPQKFELRALPMDRNGHGKRLAELSSPTTYSAIGGLQIGGKDLLLLIPKVEEETLRGALQASLVQNNISSAATLMESAGKTLGKFHTKAMQKHSIPNIERRWNDRLKKLEDLTKANTLWRAPHSPATKGTITHQNMALDILHLTNSSDQSSEIMIGGCFDSVFNSLVDLPLDHPAIRDIAALFSSLHQLLNDLEFPLENKPNAAQIDEKVEGNDLRDLESKLRLSLLSGWRSTAPPSISGERALDTHRGGVFIWEYEQKLEHLALCKIYGVETPQNLQQWLRKVSRIQAAMFQHRTWSGMALGCYVIAGGIVALWVNGTLDSFDALSAIPIAAMGFFMKRFYNSKSLPTHQPL